MMIFIWKTIYLDTVGNYFTDACFDFVTIWSLTNANISLK